MMTLRYMPCGRLDTLLVSILGLAVFLPSCDEVEDLPAIPANTETRKAKQVLEAPWTQVSPRENISTAEIEENEKLEIITTTPSGKEAAAIQEDVATLIKAKDFDALDKLALQFVENKERLVCGEWKIIPFYQGLELSSGTATPLWERRKETLELWRTEKPKSQFARIALVDFYNNYAWRARGVDYADKVTEEGWTLMGERLAKSGEIFGTALNEVEITDPSFFNFGMTIALGTNQPPTIFDELVAGSLALEPGFSATLIRRIDSLLPRWFGSKGDAEAFAEYIAENNQTFGKDQYATMIMHLYFYRGEDVNLKTINWDYMEEGVRSLIKKYPDGITNISRAAFIATVAKRKEFAKECFEALGDRCVVDVWNVNGRMCHYRNWAYTGEW